MKCNDRKIKINGFKNPGVKPERSILVVFHSEGIMHKKER